MNLGSSHFDLAQWADYVRGTVAPAANQAMTGHARTCPSCSMSLQLMRRIADTARVDQRFEPPMRAVTAAERVFRPTASSVSVAGQKWAGLRKLAGEIVWNSALDPLPVGVRSARMDRQHLVYRAGRFSVDVLVDSEPEGNVLTITGQLAVESGSYDTLRRIEAMLISSDGIVSSTTTNEFGEFSLRFERGNDMQLVIALEESGEYAEMPLCIRPVYS